MLILSVVRPRRPPLLHARLPPGHSGDGQLCSGCLRRFHRYLGRVVLYLGPQELPGPAYRDVRRGRPARWRHHLQEDLTDPHHYEEGLNSTLFSLSALACK